MIDTFVCKVIGKIISQKSSVFNYVLQGKNKIHIASFKKFFNADWITNKYILYAYSTLLHLFHTLEFVCQLKSTHAITSIAYVY